jgi:uncharacterized protein YbcI
MTTIKTQGEIESAISECMGRFEQEYIGRGPKDVHAYLIHDFARRTPCINVTTF